MATYRKRPVEIEAAQWWGKPEDMPVWCGDIESEPSGSEVRAGRIVCTDTVLRIGTVEGTMRADLGDWIIRGVKGELYPCKPDIFTATYDLVEF